MHKKELLPGQSTIIRQSQWWVRIEILTPVPDLAPKFQERERIQLHFQKSGVERERSGIFSSKLVQLQNLCNSKFSAIVQGNLQSFWFKNCKFRVNFRSKFYVIPCSKIFSGNVIKFAKNSSISPKLKPCQQQCSKKSRIFVKY